MAAIINENVALEEAEIHIIDPLAESNGKLKCLTTPKEVPLLIQYHESFGSLLGPSPTYSLLLSSTGASNNPFFHEACIYLPAHEELYCTSNLLQAASSANYPTILISRVKLRRSDRLSGENNVHTVEWAKLRPPPGIDMPNSGVNYEDGIIFCAQGSDKLGTGGIYYMPRKSPPVPLVTNFHGREFNSVNDVVVTQDGAIWFTDSTYGFEQDFRPAPKLPNQVYRFMPETGDLRVVADGFGMPNGITFAPDEKTVYITDTDAVHHEGNKLKKSLTQPATIYAFDVIVRSGGTFLANRRVFAYAAVGIPDGIKCDVHSNVYSGCGDGVEVWNPAGTLIGRIIIPGGVASFCFGKDGEMFFCAETKLWRMQLARSTKGALLGI